MSNELKINRLLEYEVLFKDLFMDGRGDDLETFTADGYTVDTATNTVRFYRTGNVIREYFSRPFKITATPVDKAEA